MESKKEKKAKKTIRSRPSNSGKRARTKGHNFERVIVNWLRKLGYSRAITTRLGSRLMDAAKIDVCNVPFNVQCKAVEAKIDYHELTKEISEEIAKLVPERGEYPIVIFHKKDKKTNVIMTLDEFEKFMRLHVVGPEMRIINPKDK
jgi:Holliday junction resolvase